MLFTDFHVNGGIVTHDTAPEETIKLFSKCIQQQNDLVQMAIRFVWEKKRETYPNMEIARRELATSSTLHRGFYCPSPIIEYVIGRVKRGKILKRPTKRSQIAYEYFFRPDGKLAYVKNYGGKAGFFTAEYLLYGENRTYGITLLDDIPCAVSEERYEAQLLTSYTYISFFCEKNDSSFRLSNEMISHEKYSYDNSGLCQWDLISADIKRNYIDHQKYIFSRENGMVCSYASVNPATGQAEGWYPIL